MAVNLTKIMLLFKRSPWLLRSVNTVKCCRMLTVYRNSDPSYCYSGNTRCIPHSQIMHIDLSKPSMKKVELPPMASSYLQIYDNIPLLNVNLPSVDLPNRINSDNINLPNKNVKIEIFEPGVKNSGGILCKHGMLKIRRKKMNKHKLKKRRKRDRAKIRKVLIGREKNRRKKRAYIKSRLQKKIENIVEVNPKSTFPERPYIMHRLTNW